MTRILLFSLGAAFALGACNSFVLILPPDRDAGTTGGGMGGGDGGMMVRDAGLPPAEACKLLTQRRCAYLGRCGLVGNDANAQDACKRTLEVTWCGPTTWPAHVAAGTLRFDWARAEDCAASFTSALCADFETLPESCNHLTQPRVPLGGECYGGYTECLEGVCRGATCPRLCLLRGVRGDVCNADADCRSGLYCNRPLLGGVRQCAAYAAVNELCGDEIVCSPDLRCDNRVCKAWPSEGQACANGRCADGLWCDATSSSGGTCTSRRDAGAPCGGDECITSAVCDPFAQVCTAREVGIGDACSALSSCLKPSQCVGVTNTDAGLCGAAVPLGEACLSTADCETHLKCILDDDGGTRCHVRATAGSACVTNSDCQLSAMCVQGSCVELPLPGMSCDETRACRWGLCRAGALDGGYVCGALLGPGMRCSRNEDCGSGACENDACLARCAP